VRKISELRPGSQAQTVVGTVFSISEVRFGRRARGSQAVITDGSGLMKAMWWNMPYVVRGLPEGSSVVAQRPSARVPRAPSDGETPSTRCSTKKRCRRGG
jgi:hypothetical protein